jgi:hypothetical protein
MSLFSPRLPHVLTADKLAQALLETYASAMKVDDDEALDRLRDALEQPDLLADLYRSLSAALAAAQGTQMSPDEVIDKLRNGIQKRKGRVKAAPDHPAIAAVLVWINLAAGVVPEKMREALGSEKGRRLLEDGVKLLGTHLVANLLK